MAVAETSRPTEPLGLAIIGAGGIARAAHMPGYQALDGVIPVAVADPAPGRAAAFAEEFGFRTHAAAYDEIVRRDDVDIVSVTTPPAFHAEAAIAALEAGKHVLVEKPMAMHATDAQAMADAAAAAERVLAIDFQTRFTWSTQRARAIVAAGDLGDPHFARAWYLRRASVPTWGAFTSKAMSGGGALTDVGVHALDQALYVLGHPTPRSVWGAAARPFGNRGGVTNASGPWDPERYDVDDFALAAIRFDGDLVMVLEASWVLRMGERSVRRLSISATRGGLQLDPLQLFHDRGGYHAVESLEAPPAPRRAHELSIADFVRAVRSGTPPLVTAAQGVDVTRITDAIYQSSRERAEIEL